jgi:hypothetical protein
MDTAGAVSVTEFGGGTALSLTEVLGERSFVTRIYVYDGWVRELFYEEGLEFLPGDGLPILEMDKLDFEMVENGLVRVSTGFGSMLISARSSAELEQEGF